MRLFFGIPLSQEVKFFLKETQTTILLNKAQGKLTNIENFHITLLFLGEIEGHYVDNICANIEDEIHDFKSFEFYLEGIGSFSKGIDQIIWVGVKNPTKDLKKLHDNIKNVMRKHKLPFDDKKFNPHITLARQVRFDPLNHTHQLSTYYHPIHVKRFHLYQSHIVNDKLTYTPIYTFDLK